MNPPSHKTLRSRSGLTLLEVLAAIVLLSIATGLAGGALLGAQAHSDLQGTIAQVSHLDRMARIHARTGQCVKLIADSRISQLRLVRTSDGKLLHQARVPGDLDFELVVSEGEASEVPFTRSGRSASYSLSIRRRDTDPTILNINGDSGLIRESREFGQ